MATSKVPAISFPAQPSNLPRVQSEAKSTLNCKYCGVPVGEVTDPWGGKHGWIHRPEDGPDAYGFCRCPCVDCYQPLGAGPCIDGEEAEPELGTLLQNLTETVAKVERQPTEREWMNFLTRGRDFEYDHDSEEL